MNVLKDLDDLRHNNDLFNDLLENVWYLNESFLIGNDWNWNVNDSINNLKNLFDMINVSHNFFELF